ncbi:MAG: DUF2844 domain-containing protein [Nitrospira sp.]
MISLGLVLHLSAVTPAAGVLGDSTATVEHDRTMVNGTSTIESKGEVYVYVVKASGIVVREYASSTGVVFGLAWKHQAGRLNLEQLFGVYYGEYSRAVAVQPRQSQRFHRIETEHLIIERGGRMGATWGRVWIPALLPPGITQDQIQ